MSGVTRVFISQPMGTLSREQINEDRERVLGVLVRANDSKLITSLDN